MNSFNALPSFEKEFKRLAKKYNSLGDDVEKFKEVLLVRPNGIGKNFTILHVTESVSIIKARMASRALRDRSLRVIYAYYEQTHSIVFLELYYKGDKENEDRGRIEEYMRSIPS